MKLQGFLPIVGLSLVFLANCSPRKNVQVDDNASKLSTLSIGELGSFANGEKPVYNKLELTITGVESTDFSKTFGFNKAEGSTEIFTDASVKLKFGAYKFTLSYLDASGKVTYESCSGAKDSQGKETLDEKSRIHRINIPVYEPIIFICSLATGISAPTLPPPKLPEPAKVVIKPTLSAPGSSTPAPAAKFYVDPTSLAANDAEIMKRSSDPNARYVDYIAKQGAAVWLGAWSGNVGDTVRTIMDKAAAQDAYPVLVAYMIPYRDCGLHSAGGLDAKNYIPWITELANAIGNRKAIVILEPDAVPGIIQKKASGEMCLSPELRKERIDLLKAAIVTLKAKTNTKVYVDAGHPAWISVDEAVTLLNQVGLDNSDGFALNTSNYQSTAANVAYGQQIRSRVGNKKFLIDTSRNGTDPGTSTEWCNPRNRSLGKAPTFNTGIEGVEAFIWGKRPGESDGACGGGPAAGVWWREIAIELAKNADLGL